MSELNMQLNSIKAGISSLVEKGFLNDASHQLKGLENIAPNDPDIYSIRSAILYYLTDLEKALGAAGVGLLLNPTHSELIYNYAYLLYEMGHDSSAKDMLSVALDHCPNPSLKTDLSNWLELLNRKYQLSDDWNCRGVSDSFLVILLKEIYSNISNNHKYNVDIEYMDLVKAPIRDAQIIEVNSERFAISKHIDGLTRLFDLLHDENSKSLLTKVLAFRLLGNEKVQLPLNNLVYWNNRKTIKKLVVSSETLLTAYERILLEIYNLEPIGIPIRMYNVAPGIHHIFVTKQYEYRNINLVIKAEENDIVIDCGGCWGDTALYFANEVGQHGHVYTMEFIPSNLSILHKNLDLNPSNKESITVVPNPVWDQTDQSMYYIDRGGASLVSLNSLGNSEEKIQSLSIDDLVVKNNLNRVDFIKMDIEGAEINALRGAVKTIKKFRPKMAISIYHSINDFQDIPDYICSICEDYIFTLNHSTILSFETILFAVPKEKIKTD